MRAMSALIGLALLLIASLASALATATDIEARIGPLGPAGAPASAFPKPARPVASIVAEQWSTEEERDRNGEAREVMKFLGVHPGMSVADIGAGGGYYTVRVAKR